MLCSIEPLVDSPVQFNRIKDFEDVGKLAKADQYFSEVSRLEGLYNPRLTHFGAQIMTIPRLSDRLECMLYRRKLELDMEEIRPELDMVHRASRELKASNRFKQVLQASAPS